MDIMELRKKPHLSASAITDYIECGLQYKFFRVDGIKKESVADVLIFGSSVHLVLAEFHQRKMFGEIIPKEEFLKLFEKYWKETFEKEKQVSFKNGNTFNSLLEEGKRLLTVYAEKYVSENFNILAIEEPFRMEIDGVNLPIIGIMDLVEEDERGTIIITDHKTASRAYSNEEIDKNFQLTIYYMAARRNGYSDREILLKFDCLIKTKTPKFEQYYTLRTEENEQRATRTIKAVLKGIKNGVFLPNENSWRCPTCAFKSHCENWFLQKEDQ